MKLPPKPLRVTGAKLTAPAGDDARHLLDALDVVAEEPRLRCLRGISRFGQTDSERQHVRGPETGVDVRQPLEAADGEAGAGQQHEGQCHLRRYQRAAQPPASAARSAVAPDVLQEHREVRPRRDDRRRGAEENAGDDGEEDAEGQNRPVHLDVGGARQIGRRHRHQGAHAPRAEQESGGAAGERQDHTLGQELADEAPAAGAERRAHRDLPVLVGRARQQQIRDVDARDQEDADHGPEEDEERPPDLADHRRQQWNRGDRISAAAWSGNRAAMPCSMRSRSAVACAADTPGRSRPTAAR